MTKKEALLKAASYCAYQERSQKEVRNKLFELGLYSDEVEVVIVELIAENFLNEERFAIAFVGGKFRVKKWGRNKILMALKQHDISDYCLKKGMEEIDEEEYRNALLHILKSKGRQLKDKDAFVKKNKMARHAIAKGYEPELVWELLKQMDS